MSWPHGEGAVQRIVFSGNGTDSRGVGTKKIGLTGNSNPLATFLGKGATTGPLHALCLTLKLDFV